MNQHNYPRLIALIALLQLGFIACGKKEAPSSTPDLSMRATKEPAAEASVVAVTGPLELTLDVFKTKVKSEKESLWYQVRLRNLGKEAIPIFEPEFLGPTMPEIHRSAGLSLWVTGPDGKVLKTSPRHGGGAVLVPGSPSWPIQEGDKRDKQTQQKIIDTMWADRAILRKREEYAQELERKGLSPAEIERKSLVFNEEHPLSDDGTQPKPRPHYLLQPGASITNVACAGESNSEPSPPRGYTEFWGYWYTKPGKYRIKAAFDRRQRGWIADYYKEHGITPSPDAVLVETETIEFEVVP